MHSHLTGNWNDVQREEKAKTELGQEEGQQSVRKDKDLKPQLKRGKKCSPTANIQKDEGNHGRVQKEPSKKKGSTHKRLKKKTNVGSLQRERRESDLRF